MMWIMRQHPLTLALMVEIRQLGQGFEFPALVLQPTTGINHAYHTIAHVSQDTDLYQGQDLPRHPGLHCLWPRDSLPSPNSKFVNWLLNWHPLAGLWAVLFYNIKTKMYFYYGILCCGWDYREASPWELQEAWTG